MEGLISAEEFRQKFKTEERYTRQEIAFAFTSGSEPINHVAITRDVQALYGKEFQRKALPWDVVVELYLVRLFRKERTQVYGSSYVSKDEIRSFIGLFDAIESPKEEYKAKWAYASRWGGGEAHFQKQVIDKIKVARFSKTLNTQDKTVTCLYTQVA